jgi:hypothetical protein
MDSKQMARLMRAVRHFEAKAYSAMEAKGWGLHPDDPATEKAQKRVYAALEKARAAIVALVEEFAAAAVPAAKAKKAK